MRFGFVPVDMILSFPNMRNAFVRLLKEVTDACNLKNDFKGLLLMLAQPEKFPKLFLRTTGLYVLTDGSEVFAAAILAKADVLDGIYVPEKHRRQ